MEKGLNNILRKLVFVTVSLTIVSCTCATPLRVTEIQKTDKKLSCKEVILEINESEHYRDLAKKESGIGFGNMLMPVCWVSSYTDTSKAIKSANTRIKYLGGIYDVLDCGGKSDKGEGQETVVAPPVIRVQPLPAAPAAPAPAPVIVVPAAPAPAPVVAPAPKAKEKDDDEPVVKGEADVDDRIAKKNMHQHVDKFGKVYTHSHFYSGPHKHLDD